MLARMIAGNGLKTNAEWETMSHLERVAWVDGLDPINILAQASVRAAGSRCSVAQILNAWRLHGYLSDERAAAALAAKVPA